MATSPLDFRYSDQAEPHRGRTQAILKAHPEIRALVGKNPGTALLAVGVVAAMFAAAWLLRDQRWWLVLAAAYLFGAFADHSLFVVIHECAHNLIFKRRHLNTLLGIVSNLPQVLPSSVTFQRYHLKHHSFQGVYELDADLPSRWEARLVGGSCLGKALWFLLFPIGQTVRVARLKEIRPFDRWTVINWLAVFGADFAVWYWLGPKAFVFLLASTWFSVGLHPLGARWVQEHYLISGPFQETHSYYGSLNVLALNVGYHNEHHDFPSIPWNRLPRVRATAPAFYDTLAYHRSWTLLFLRFLFDSEITLFLRIVRRDRNNLAVREEAIPDDDPTLAERPEPAAVGR